jgi:hypothetical protein
MAVATKSPKSHLRKPLTAERLRELLSYDPETGGWTRIKHCARGSHIKVGDMAGGQDERGYLRIRVDGRKYKGHRLAFLYMTGQWPKPEIDHIDGDRTNNCWSNLREATHNENMWNMKMRRNNTSGLKGVTWHKPSRRWRAQICLYSRRLGLGYFDTAEAAHDAYKAKAIELFGEFARTD